MGFKVPEFLPESSFIERKAKYDFALKICFLMLFSSVLSAAVLYFVYARKLTSGYSGTFLTLIEIKEFLTISIALTVLIEWFFVSTLTFFITLFVSHKIAGPVYRFEQSLKRMKNGHLSENLYNIRAGDQVRPLSESLNEMSAAVMFRTSEIKSRVTEIVHAGNRISESMRGESAEEKNMLELSNEIAGFKRLVGEAKELITGSFIFRKD